MTGLTEPATNNPFSDEIRVNYDNDSSYGPGIHVRIWGCMGYFMTSEQAKELRDKLDMALREVE